MTEANGARLFEAIELSEAICDVAETGDWEQVLRLLVDRQQILERTFSSPVEPESAEATAAAIQSLFAIDQRIFQSLEAARKDARGNLQALDLERRAQSVYRKV